MTALLLTLPGGNSLPGALFLARNPASLGLKCDFKRGLVTQNSTIFHPQTEEVDAEKADSKSHFLELHSTPRESRAGLRQGKVKRCTQAAPATAPITAGSLHQDVGNKAIRMDTTVFPLCDLD